MNISPSRDRTSITHKQMLVLGYVEAHFHLHAQLDCSRFVLLTIVVVVMPTFCALLIYLAFAI